MIEVPADAAERTLVTFVRGWLKLMAAGRWRDACGMIDEPNCYGIVWTPERIQQVVEKTFGEGIRWTDPDELGDGGHPEAYPMRDGSGYSFEHNVPLNGEWSDLTAEFEFRRRPQGYAVLLHDLHVM